MAGKAIPMSGVRIEIDEALAALQCRAPGRETAKVDATCGGAAGARMNQSGRHRP